MKAKILLVEDDKNLGFIIKDFLNNDDYQVDLAINGVEGLEYFIRKKYDLILLDIMMPLKDGFTVAHEIRHKDSEVPIIFLTAKSMDEDKIRGFRLGADDYVTKPFSTEELKLRIQAILKRKNSNNGYKNPEPVIHSIGSLNFDYSNQSIIVGSEIKKLTKKESELLNLLCLNKNSILRRDIALKAIWGEDDYFMGRSMDVYIAKLRKMLKADPTATIINVHNIGFKLID
jgi:DNA-binding response OmpR family regulator